MVTPYANSPAEDREEAKRKRKGRRNAIFVIGIINVLVLVDGFSGASDLRRMATPQGAAASWADAAAANDCDTYVGIEGADRLAADLAGISLGPTVETQRGGLCQQVGQAWMGVSVQTSDVVARGNDTAVVRLSVTGRTTGTITGEVLMRRVGGRWHVEPGGGSCPTPAYTPRASLCPAVDLPGT